MSARAPRRCGVCGDLTHTRRFHRRDEPWPGQHPVGPPPPVRLPPCEVALDAIAAGWWHATTGQPVTWRYVLHDSLARVRSLCTPSMTVDECIAVFDHGARVRDRWYRMFLAQRNFDHDKAWSIADARERGTAGVIELDEYRERRRAQMGEEA